MTSTQFPRQILFRAATCLLSLAPSTVLAQEAEQEDVEQEAETTAAPDGDEGEQTLADRIQAVQRKLFVKEGRFELMPMVAMDVNDAFFQHVFVGAGASYHLHDALALELRGAYALAESKKDAVRFVRVATGSLLEGAPSLLAHADVNLTWAPLYGKISLFSEGILHFDTFLSLGGGIFATTVEQRASEEAPLEEVTNVNPAVNIGLGQRYFVNDFFVIRWELRNYSYVESGPRSDLRNVTLLGLGFSFFLPSAPEPDQP